MGKPNIDVNCDNCGKPFKVTSQRLGNNTICCSIECMAELKKSMRKPNCKCYVCLKEFYVKPFHLNSLKNKDRVTCSRDCSKVERSERMSGEGNHQYGLLGELNGSYLSDIKISSYGYILVRNAVHPLRMSDNYMLLHRLIMEEYLRQTKQFDYLTTIDGQLVLLPGLVVHHKDGNRLNNVIDNLHIMSLEEHSSDHAKERTIIRDELGRISSLNIKGELKSGKLKRNQRLDAGQDILSADTLIIPARGSNLISTNLVINIPENFVGLIWARSGLSVKHKLEVGAGCIDSGYHGEVKVHLYNHSDIPYKVNSGDKIAQLLTIPVNLASYDEVLEFACDSDRGNNGFGSSGYSDEDTSSRIERNNGVIS